MKTRFLEYAYVSALDYHGHWLVHDLTAEDRDDVRTGATLIVAALPARAQLPFRRVVIDRRGNFVTAKASPVAILHALIFAGEPVPLSVRAAVVRSASSLIS
jgi:hypothetical protein